MSKTKVQKQILLGKTFYMQILHSSCVRYGCCPASRASFGLPKKIGRSKETLFAGYTGAKVRSESRM